MSETDERVALVEDLWEASDVARYFKVSRSWVYHKVESGKLPFRRIGGLIRFDPYVIRNYDESSVTKRPRRLHPTRRALGTSG